MNLLYYCPEYYYRHGGRTHARGFFGALKEVPMVKGYYLYPKDDPGMSDNQEKPGKTARGGKLWFLPSTPRRIIQHFKSERRLTRILGEEIRANSCDALVIRTGTKLPMLKELKRSFPGLKICLEINSAYFDESFQGLPMRSFFQQWEVDRFKAADVFTVVSQYLKDYLIKRGLPEDKILVNPNGVNVNAVDVCKSGGLRAQYGIPEGAFVTGYIGGMEPFRRLPEVIRHIADMRRRGVNDLVLLLIGDGSDMPAVREAIEQNRDDLDDAVILTGWLDHGEATAMLGVFDIAIFPFTNDYCSPLKLFEYLGAGVPTIGPDTSAVTEVFRENEHLVLVKQDGSDFDEAVVRLKNNPDLRSKLADNGRKLVLEEYTWEKNAERVVQHIERMA